MFESARAEFNFDAGVLTVHDGKGQKDRTVPLSETILPELRAHLEPLKDLHHTWAGLLSGGGPARVDP